MIEETINQIDEPNRWRLETPGHEGWPRTARPGDPNRYLMISADCHANEPSGSMASADRQEVPSPPAAHRSRRKRRQVVSDEGMQRSRMIDSQMTGEEAIRNKSGYTR